MQLDLRAVARRMRTATTEALLDRVTAYRQEMEPAALDLIEGELARRGVTSQQIEDYARVQFDQWLIRPDGTVVRCHFCERPAVAQARGWFRIFRYLPIYPRLFACCADHHHDSRSKKPSDGS